MADFLLLWKNCVQKLLRGWRLVDSPTEISKRFGIVRKTVYSAKNIYEATGDFKKTVKGGAPRKVHTKQLVQNTKKKIDRNPIHSIQKMAKDASVSNTTMRRVIRDDLKMKSRAKEQWQTLIEVNRAKRVTCCKSILNWMKSNPRKAIVFLMNKIGMLTCITITKTPDTWPKASQMLIQV